MSKRISLRSDFMEDKPNKLVFKKEDIWLIPNVITYFRMLCIPVFVTLCLVGGLKGKPDLIYWALGVFFVAACSDLVDGKIARKYNMVSDIGKVFDPLADKLMHVSSILCLVIINYMPWYFLVLIAVKELLMICFSPMLLKRKIVIQAVFAGKIASAVISGGVVLTFFHALLVKWWTFGTTVQGIQMSLDWIVMLIGCVLAVYALVTYIVIMLKALKKFDADFKAGKIDKFGNRLDETTEDAKSEPVAQDAENESATK